MTSIERDLTSLVQREYKEGFVTEIESDTLPPGLNEDVIRTISARKGEPEFLLAWRLEAYRRWLAMPQPPYARCPRTGHRHHPLHVPMLRAFDQ